ncbi:hypothetical protein GQ54DRAFT_117426 [Martensiomyces pterosporus]|nr:hypothetical protein GQ54DRAFT_117426 [Martensiomyces pterosporus]
MEFRSTVRDTLFQVPPDIGCVNLRSLLLGVEIDFKSMLRLLSNLKHLIELELNVDYVSINRLNGRQGDTGEDVDERQPPQAEYLPVRSTLSCFTCCLYSPKGCRCYKASYAFELALHLPALESMTLGVDKKRRCGFLPSAARQVPSGAVRVSIHERWALECQSHGRLLVTLPRSSD